MVTTTITPPKKITSKATLSHLTSQTTLGSSVALWLMSDGAEWFQVK